MLLNCGLEKTVESPLDCKEIQPVHPEDQSWIFIGRTDVKAEAPILWSLNAKSWLIGKDPDAGKDWRQEKWATEDEMASLDGHEFEQTPRDSGGPGILESTVHGVAKSQTRLSDWTTTNGEVSSSRLITTVNN